MGEGGHKLLKSKDGRAWRDSSRPKCFLYGHEDLSLDTGTYVKAGDGSLRL